MWGVKSMGKTAEELAKLDRPWKSDGEVKVLLGDIVRSGDKSDLSWIDKTSKPVKEVGDGKV